MKLKMARQNISKVMQFINVIVDFNYLAQPNKDVSPALERGVAIHLFVYKKVSNVHAYI